MKLEVLGQGEDACQVKEISLNESNWFIKRDMYSNQIIDCVLNICAFFIREFVGEASFP